MRTLFVFIMAVSFILGGCGKSSEQIELENQNAKLKQDLAAKDKFVEDVTLAINEIHDKLEITVAMEKNILRQTPTVEEGKLLSQADLKVRIMDRIANISTILTENRNKITGLQRKLAQAKTKYTGLSQMVADLQKNLDEREKTIAQLQTQVLNLEGEITSKTEIIAARDLTIESQTKQINTVYYVAGKMNELKEKQIVTSEGGIFWGLLGTTTVLTNGYNETEFSKLDKSKDKYIEVAGVIDEIVPERDPSSYKQELKANNRTLLTITKPESFWRDNHLAIITD
ncbi:MAG: hypothetical protein JXA06_05665 [Bacteroidetes bacterium]|nr:hypothetical protein [Bacteroidota bacterium]